MDVMLQKEKQWQGPTHQLISVGDCDVLWSYNPLLLSLLIRYRANAHPNDLHVK